MQRTIYSCDWCGVDAPKPGLIGDGWMFCETPLRVQNKREVLCAGCHQVACGVWERAKERCRADEVSRNPRAT